MVGDGHQVQPRVQWSPDALSGRSKVRSARQSILVTEVRSWPELRYSVQVSRWRLVKGIQRPVVYSGP